MKPKPLFLLVAAALATFASAGAAESITAAPRTEVLFFEPEKFTDVRDNVTGDYERTAYLDQIRDHLVSQARHYVPAGYRLAVTFTDVDMAGEFEPWRGPRWSEIRVVKDIYPPRITLSFRVVDPEGNVVKEGRRELRDLAFMMKLSMPNDDATRHEKALIDDWLRDEFPRVAKR